MANAANDNFFFFGHTTAGEIARSVDWSKSPLGDPETWQIELKLTLGPMFENRHPQALFWAKGSAHFYNDAFVPILGKVKHPGAMGGDFRLVWAEVWPLVGPLIEGVLKNGQSVWNEDQLVPIIGDDGNIRDAYFTYSYSPVYLLDGSIGGMLVTCLETTKKIEADRKLSVSSQDISDILENMSDAFFTVDADWSVGHVNEQFEKVIKTNRKNVIGKSLLDLYFRTPEQKESQYVKTYSRVMKERVPASFVEYYEPFDIWTAVSVYPKSSGGIAVFFREISEEKRKAKSLQDAIIARDTFLGIASHELNTPLTTLKLQGQSNLRLLNKKGMEAFSEAKIRQLLEIFLSSTNRLARLVDDMLDVSRIESGKLRITCSKVNVSALIEKIVKRFQNEGETDPVMKYHVSIEPDIEANIDAFRIEQVVANLLTNAIKYAPGVVEIKLTSEKKNFVLTIKDYGLGIPKEHREKIFEKFERRETRTEVSGLGLGLFISKQIVDAHRGKLQLRGGSGEGAVFVMTVPL